MSELPLISCIMPTLGKRRRFVAQAIRYFNRQDYPNKELIIVDEYDEYGHVFGPLLPQHNLHLISIKPISIKSDDGHLTVGAKRNLAISLAKGEIICLWDDDDYYGPQRLSHQAQPIINYEADITAPVLDVVFNALDRQAWKCTHALNKEIFASGVVTGAVMFRKRLWGWMASFPSVSRGEDADFLRIVCGQNAELMQLENAGDFIYVRHEVRNLWPLPPTPYPHMHEWQQVEIEQYLPEQDRAFYAELRDEVRV